MTARRSVAADRSVLRLASIIGLLWLAPATAHAYIDPGTGMLVWQSLLAVLGAAIVFIRHPVQTLKRWWARWFGSR